MKIAMLVHRFPSLSETFIALQISALCQFPDCEVEIFSLGSQGEPDWLPKGTEAALSAVQLHAYDRDVKPKPKFLRYLSILRRNPVAFLKYFILRNKPVRFKTLVNDLTLFGDLSRFDIVHCQFATIGNNLAAYKKHGFIAPEVRLSCAIRGYDVSREDVVRSIRWPDIFEQVSLFLPVCGFFEDKLLAMGCKQAISLCPSPVNTFQSLVQSGPERVDGPLRLISVGRLTEKKGLDVALRACRYLLDEGVQFEYHVIGGGEDQAALLALRDELALSGCVFFHGAWQSERVIAFYSEVDLLLAPSKTATNGDSEGIPNVLKEAMIAGVPVVTSRHAGIPELVTDGVTGFLCDENSEQDLYRSLKRAMSHKDQWPDIADKARNKVLKEYDPMRCAEKLYDDFLALSGSSQ